MSRQDGVYPRTAAALEQKHGFGKTFAELMGISQDAQTHAYKAEEKADEANETAKEALTKITDLDTGVISQLLIDVEGIHADVYGEGGINARLDLALVTDADGNLLSEVNIGANKMTILTDKFQLLGDGTIVANAGMIANWSIREDEICKYATMTNKETGAEETYKTSIYGIPYTEENIIPYNPVFGVLNVTTNEWQYFVRSNGALFAKNAEIHGKVCAESGDIGGILIEHDRLYSANADESKWFLIASPDLALKNSGNWMAAYNDEVNPNYPVYMLNPAGDLYSFTVRSDSGQITSSDRNMKNTIADLTEQYSVFFDNLRAVTHKYNNGQSDRLHAGFIAQEVDEALSAAGLTRQDFAGICIENEGTESERWSLRYTEFIPLLVNEIQELKRKLKELGGSYDRTDET